MKRAYAYRLMIDAHAGIDDKGGEPYIYHPLAVEHAVSMLGEDYQVVALLHDVFEDTERVIEMFLPGALALPGLAEDEYLTPRQEKALRAITKKDEESNEDYLARVKSDLIASVVKVADVKHNRSPERQGKLDAKTQARLEKKYDRALEVLEGP
jgi:(p)ppGpp synthase/HD superfamily hydrolase